MIEVSKWWKIVEFSKISIKTKSCKTFCKAQTASRLKKTIQPTPNHPFHPHQIRSYHVSDIFKEIYRNIQTFDFKLLQECSSWASRTGAVQIFFLAPNRNMFVGKLVKSERFWTVLQGHIILMSSELRFVKWVRFFVWNCNVKYVIFLLAFVGSETLC